MKLESAHLEILAAIVDHGGLTEGAEAIGKSQPSVSRIMSYLEDRVGMPLFEPGRRPLRPTELGLALARLGTRIHATNNEASQLIARFRQGAAGLLRVGGSPIFMDGVVSRVIAGFQSGFPDVQIDQTSGYLDTLAPALRLGRLDLAILPVHERQIPRDMTFLPLMEGHNVVACRLGHPLLSATDITASDLERFSWIAPPADSPLYRDMERTLAAAGCENFRIAFSGGTLAAILSVLRGSEALTILPLSVMREAMRDLPVGILSLRIGHPDRQLGLLRMTSGEGPPALEHFVRFAADELGLLQRQLDQEFGELAAAAQRGTGTLLAVPAPAAEASRA